MTAMFGLDEAIAELGADGGLVIALVAALLLGLRHATDPDHLTAISTLVASEDREEVPRAGRLGLAWGAGHALTLVALGAPVVLFNDAIPETAQQIAELVIGAVIVALAIRLLVRWRRGYFHVHAHEHADGTRHAHPHVHEGAHGNPGAHDHAHADPVRSTRAAFGIGLLHGTGGSAGVGILLIAGIDGDAEAVVALLLFAAGTAVTMALVSAAWGRLLASRAVERRLATLIPLFATAGLLFGCWYGLGAFA
jgi:ABC-type nickel/cobalt efflux system permease component RcnA